MNYYNRVYLTITIDIIIRIVPEAVSDFVILSPSVYDNYLYRTIRNFSFLAKLLGFDEVTVETIVKSY